MSRGRVKCYVNLFGEHSTQALASPWALIKVGPCLPLPLALPLSSPRSRYRRPALSSPRCHHRRPALSSLQYVVIINGLPASLRPTFRPPRSQLAIMSDGCEAARKIERLIRLLDAANAEKVKLKMEIEDLEARFTRFPLLALYPQPSQGCEEMAQALALKAEALELALSLLDKERTHADRLAARAADLHHLYQPGAPDPEDKLLGDLLARMAGTMQEG